MADFTAADVKKLRDLTGAGMMDSKKALTEAEGDFDKAVEILRIKGAKDVGKRAGRTAANGLVAHSGNALLELNCETDFVAKNGRVHRARASGWSSTAPAPASPTPRALLASTLDGKTVADTVQEASAKIGEKLVLNRFAGARRHRSPSTCTARARTCRRRSACWSQYTGKSDEAADADARGVAMQIAAMRPKYLTRDEVPAEVVESERRIAEQTAREEGKPEAALPKIVEGRANAFFKDFVLLEQASVTDNKKTVKQVLAEAGIEVTRFVRFEVGQA